MVFPNETENNSACCAPLAPRNLNDHAAEGVVSNVNSAHANFGATDGMRRLDGGMFIMGTDSAQAWAGDGEGPVREVQLAPFWIDIYAVTNAQFEDFARATDYITEAERFGWSYVFHLHLSRKARSYVVGEAGGSEWWLGIEGACWKRPDGPGSTIRKRMDHPVVHISWNDAVAYCNWTGKRLPTEAESEYAARGGLVQKTYPWGDEFNPPDQNGIPQTRCNIWEGEFPKFSAKPDGCSGTMPVDSYAPNGYGLYNMSGNAWEWCSDWFSPAHPPERPIVDPQGASHGTAKVMKGGSHLCHPSYCNRYRVAARTANTPDSTAGHSGFRCARSVEE